MALNPTLPRSFYERHPKQVARNLLGCYIVRRYHKKLLVGKIVETEAYLSTRDDPASHGFKPASPRTQSLFGEAGHAYVTNVHRYMIMNVVTEGPGKPSGVLIRAIEPVEGIETMKTLRRDVPLHNLTNGPGKLTLALDIKRRHNGIDITTSTSEIFFTEGNNKNPPKIVSSPRIGISKATELPLRFCIAGNPYCSRT